MKKKNKMNKTNKKRIVTSLVLVALALLMVVGVFMLSPMKASAATVTTPVRTTYGNYTYDGSTYSGYPSSYFKVTMHGASTSGTNTMYNDELTSWTWYYIKVVDVDIREHISFKLYRNNYLYSSSTLSGTGDKTIFSGNLSDGEYRLEYVCNIGNWFSNKDYTYTYRFEVDKTAPTATLKAGGSTISDGTYTNKQVVYSATDANTVRIRVMSPSATSYSTSYNSSYTVSATAANNGWWYVYALDSMDNSTSAKSFYMDTVAPVGKVTNANGSTITNGGYTNKAVKYSATDTGGVSYYQVKKPGSSSWESYTANTALSSSYGWYTFRAVDKAGNTSAEYKVYYDAGVPTGTVYGGTTSKTSGSYTNASYVKYVATDSYSGIANCYVKMPNSTYYSAYASGTQLATEGTYYFYAIDKAGNQSSVVTITLDKTKPTGVLYGGTSTLSSGDSTNASYVKFVPSDNISLGSIYVKKPGTSTYAAYTSGTQLTAEGSYTFYCTDKAGNTSAYYTVTIDRQIPSAQLYVDGKAVSNGTYTNGAYIKFVCSEDCFVKTPDSSTYTAYVSGTEFSKAGKYVFYGLDEAGNSTGNYTIIIDRTSKSVTLGSVVDGKTNGDVKLSWTNGDSNVYAPITSVTVNGKSVTNGATIHTIDTGSYKVVVTDKAGNVWTTEFSSTKKNVLTDTLAKEYYEVTDKDGNVFAFASYENALAFATEIENGSVTTATWNGETWDGGIAMDALDSANAVNGSYFIYKKSGNPNEKVAYFTLDRLNAVIAEYAEDKVISYYYWQKAPATAAEGENLYSYSADKTILANSVALGENIGVLLNGEEFVGNLIELEGRHTVTVTDDYGNTCDYNVVIIRNTPNVFYAVGEGTPNAVDYERTYYFKDSITVSITDELDEMAMFRIYRVIDEDKSELVTIKSVGETYTLTESGVYTVVAVNHAGDAEVFNLVISRNAPSVSITENETDKKLEVKITESSDVVSNLKTLEIYKSTDKGATWMLVEKDDYGTVVSLDTLSYAFRTTGMYKVIVTDEFRTGIDAITAQKDYVQKAPSGILDGVTDGGHTNTIVSFEWDDEVIVTVTKDGEPIEYKSGRDLTEDGKYTITIENYDGYKATYSFTIDTEEPVAVIEGAKANDTVNTDVRVTFEGEGVTAELYKNGIPVGAYVSDTPVTESGEYKVVVTDLAQNTSEVVFFIDKDVDYAINIHDGGLSNSVTVTTEEKVEAVLTKNGTPVEYKVGDAITEPAEYTITLTDKLGNKAEVSFTIVTPVVKAYSYNFDDMAGFEKVLVNGEEARLNYGTLEISAEGVYEIGVVVNGTTYTYKVTVDNSVSFAANVHNGGFANSVKLTANEGVTVSVTKNGESFAYKLGDEITEPATYKATFTDATGNVKELNFTVIASELGKFEEEIDKIEGYEKVFVNGVETTIEKGTLTLGESGTYEVAIVAGGVTNKFTVSVDATAPTLTLNGVENGGATTDVVTLTDVSEEATVKVFFNDEEIEYTIGDELSEVGSYKVVVDDGFNTTEYSFEIEKGANIALIVIAIILGLGAAGTAVFFYFKKKNSI